MIHSVRIYSPQVATQVLVQLGLLPGQFLWLFLWLVGWLSGGQFLWFLWLANRMGWATGGRSGRTDADHLRCQAARGAAWQKKPLKGARALRECGQKTEHSYKLLHIHTNTHTHTVTHIYIYIYIWNSVASPPPPPPHQWSWVRQVPPSPLWLWSCGWVVEIWVGLELV